MENKNRNLSFIKLFIYTNARSIGITLIALLSLSYTWGMISNMQYFYDMYLLNTLRETVHTTSYIEIFPNATLTIITLAILTIMSKLIHSFINENEYVSFYTIPVNNITKYTTILLALVSSFIIGYIVSQISLLLQVVTMYKGTLNESIWINPMDYIIGNYNKTFMNVIVILSSILFASIIYFKRFYMVIVITILASIIYIAIVSKEVIATKILALVISLLLFICGYFFLTKKQNLR